MTLIIALACRDGIVMASDGQATGGSAGGPIRMPIQKIYAINNHVLFGASGSVGVIQKSRALIHSLSQELEKEWDFDLMEKVRQSLLSIYIKMKLIDIKHFIKILPWRILEMLLLLMCCYVIS